MKHPQHRLRGQIVAFALLALTATACGNPESPLQDTPSPQEDAGDQASCRLDRDCDADQFCDQGLCAPDPLFCERNSDCPEGSLCQRETLRCAPDPSNPTPCTDEGQCFAGESCVDGACTPTQDMGGPDARAEDMVEEDTTPDLTPDLPSEDVFEEDTTPDLPPEDVTEEDLPPGDMGGEVDMEPDVAPDMVADAEMDAQEDAEDMFEPPPTPAPGVYTYQRMEIGGLEALSHVIFHPSGDYALALEGRDVLHVIHWNPQSGLPQSARLVMPDASPSYLWRDVRFDPSGQFALLVGAREQESEADNYGFVVKFQDAAWRTGAPTTEVLTELTGLNLPNPVQALRYPWDDGDPVLLMRADRGPETIHLRSLDPQAERLAGFIAQTEADAGCDDLAFVNNEEGGPGVLVVCGQSGADVHYYSLRQGQWGWEANPGNNNLGNTSSVGAHRGGGYALIISSSGRAIHRFEGGQLGAYSDAIRFTTRSILGVAFQQEGQRALIHGGSYFSGSDPETNIGVLYEYRHDEFTCARANTEDCDVRPIHIQGFDQAPYNAIRSSRTKLTDVAWRPGCDGGLITSSYSDWQTSNGQIITFQIEGGRPCF